MNTIIFKKKLLLSVLMLVVSFSSPAWAQEIVIDGLGYNIYTFNNTAKVTSCQSTATQVGDINIPAAISHDGKSYTVDKINYEAFKGCTALTSIRIPNSVTEIEESAFEGCSSLGAVTIPNSVKAIARNVFKGCTALTSISIPNSVTEIEESAFEGCSNLRDVTIPQSVKTIGINAFRGCAALSSITSHIKNPQSVVYESLISRYNEVSLFTAVDKTKCTLHVPKGRKELYMATAPWSALNNIVDDATSKVVSPVDTISDVEHLKALFTDNYLDDPSLACEAAHKLLSNPDFVVDSCNAQFIVEIADKCRSEKWYVDAAKAYEDAINIYKTLHGDHRQELLTISLKMAQCCWWQNNDDLAAKHYTEAQATFEQIKEAIADGEILKNMGDAYMFTHNYSGAQECYQSALHYKKEETSHFSSFIRYNSIADILYGLCKCSIANEDFDKASVYLQQADNSQGGNSISRGMVLSFCNKLLREKMDSCFGHQQYARAIAYYEQVKEFVQRNNLYNYIIGQIDSYNAQMAGRCYHCLKDYDKALQCYDDAQSTLDIRHRFFSDERLMLWSDRALCYMDMGQYDDAIVELTSAMRHQVENTVFYFGSNSASDRENYWSDYSQLYHSVYPAAVLNYVTQPSGTSYYIGELTPYLYDYSALFAKGLLLNSETELQRIIKDSSSPDLTEKFNHLMSIKGEIIQLSQQHGNEDQSDENYMFELKNEADYWEEYLLKESTAYGDFKHNLQVTSQDVQRSLGDDDLAVEFLSFPKYGTDSVIYVALTLRNDTVYAPRLRVLCYEDQLKAATDRAYTSSELSNLIWGQLWRAGDLKGVKNIYFSPCGLLHTIAIESVPRWDNPNVMLSDSSQYNIYRLSSTRELALHRVPVAASGAAVYGGIDYETPFNKMGAADASNNGTATRGSDDGSLLLPSQQLIDQMGQSSAASISRAYEINTRSDGSGHLQWRFLAESEEEAMMVSTMLTTHGMNVDFKSRSQATETSFKNLKDKRIIHLATHGFYWTNATMLHDKLESRISFMPVDYESQLAQNRAMVTSGILFAGAQHTFDGEKSTEGLDDGVLTAQEASCLDLRGLDLLVLSACETGLGEISGDGVFGLQRGFKMAGAKSIVMSLWQVDDLASRDMMTAFYSRLNADLSNKRWAFLEAQRQVRAKELAGDYDKKNPTTQEREADLWRKQHKPHWAAFILLDATQQ